MTSRAKQQCRVCGGESFTTDHGLRVCDQCGRQEEHYVELLSQETIGEADRSRLLRTRMEEPEEEGKATSHQEKELNNWTTYDAYNCILYEWTKAMVKLGASSKFAEIVFKLWVAYLQRIGIAFMQKQKRYSLSSLKSNRDMNLIYKKAESVESSSLHSYRLRRKKKKKKAERTKLDKIKDKIEDKKLRNEIRNRRDSSFMNTTLASELSKSLIEFEASRLSDSGTSLSSSCDGESRVNKSGKSESSFHGGGSSHLSNFASVSESEGEAQPHVRKEQIRRNDIVRNWIKRRTHIYSSDSEEVQEHEQKKVEKDETGKVKRRESHTEEDEDSDSEATTEGISSSEQGRTSSRRPRKIHNIKKCDYRKIRKKAEKAAEKVTGYRGSRLPFILSFPKLLSLLYLAVLLAEEDFLLSDIIRWCREGHIPYFSAPYLLRPNMEVGFYDLNIFRSCKNLPDAQEVQASAGRLAVFLSIQYVPLPTVEGIMKKFVQLLNLPEEVATVAENHIKMIDDMTAGLAVPPVESMAMASIIMALKVFCGLDDHTEVMLSRAADVVKTELPSFTAITPFSWQDWQKHITRLVWVCCRVDPPTAFHWQPLHEICHFSPEVFTKYFWSEGMWRVPRTSLKKKAKLQRVIEELMEQQGLSLEEAVMQPPLFEPSKQPLRSIVEQLLQRDRTAQSKETLRCIKVAEELKKESFVNHSLYWIDDVGCLVSKLGRHGSKKILRVTIREGDTKPTNTRSTKIIQSRHDEARDENVQSRFQELLIPHPLTHYWKIMPKKYATWEKVSPHLPSSFKWLVAVGSNVCEAPKMQIFRLLHQLQIKMKLRKRS